jgi:hypothetical protein
MPRWGLLAASAVALTSAQQFTCDDPQSVIPDIFQGTGKGTVLGFPGELTISAWGVAARLSGGAGGADVGGFCATNATAVDVDAMVWNILANSEVQGYEGIWCLRTQRDRNPDGSPLLRMNVFFGDPMKLPSDCPTDPTEGQMFELTDFTPSQGGNSPGNGAGASSLAVTAAVATVLAVAASAASAGSA